MQRFRNLRRSSEPCKTTSTSKKKQTAAFAAPVASSTDHYDIEGGDQLAYDRTNSSLMESYSDDHPDIEYVTQLMKLTHMKRRKFITQSIKSTLVLKTEYPFFGYQLWVRML